MRNIIIATLLFWLSACTNMASLPNGSTQKSELINHENQLITVYNRYKGAPYRYGGTTIDGFDCSGFITRMYLDAFNMKVPRTTTALVRAGKPIRRDQLLAGDLVFFKTSDKQLHAGIYISENQFVHASTSKGVIASSFDNRYWRQHYLKARRLL